MSGVLRLQGSADVGDRKAFALVNGPAREGWGRVSPDGRWLTFLSDESGRYEIFAMRFPPRTGSCRESSLPGFLHGGAVGLLDDRSLRQAELEQLGAPRGEHDVAWLQIAVDDAGAVGAAEGGDSRSKW